MVSNILDHISRLDSHVRFMVSLAVAFIAYFLVPTDFSTPAHVVAIWVAFATSSLVLAWITILRLHPRDLPRLSRIEDSSRLLLLVFAVIASLASLFAVIALLNAMEQNREEHLFLPILAVISAWAVVHTVFTLRYAHLYYGDDELQKKRPGGLDFPHDTEPDYLDFAYFSFVIGMTSQVSDVAIGSKVMRRTALVHGVLSFAFNAIVIALTISGISK